MAREKKPATIELDCANCSARFLKSGEEYRKRINAGQTEFYCGGSCRASGVNLRRPRRNLSITLTCSNCSEPFKRSRARYELWKQQGKMDVLCSKSCSLELIVKRRQFSINSCFVYFERRCRERRKAHPNKLGQRVIDERFINSNIDAEYLHQIWLKQQGICPLTGWSLTLPRSQGFSNRRDMRNASVDRIDNTKGYVKGNVRFVALMVNLARGVYSDDQVVEFSRAVTSYNILLP